MPAAPTGEGGARSAQTQRLISAAVARRGASRSFGRNARAQGRYVRERCQQRREAGGAQRMISLAGLAAEPLDRRDRVVADAVDRKDNPVGAADESRQERGGVLDAAVVVQEARARALDQVLEQRHLVPRPPT